MIQYAILAHIHRTCVVWGLPYKLYVNKVFMFILHRNRQSIQLGTQPSISIFDCHNASHSSIRHILLLDLLVIFGWDLQILLIAHVHLACQQHINLNENFKVQLFIYFSNFQLYIASYSCNLFQNYFKGAKLWWLFAQLYKNPTDNLFCVECLV